MLFSQDLQRAVGAAGLPFDPDFLFMVAEKRHSSDSAQKYFPVIHQ
jgi:hypothetical protein